MGPTSLSLFLFLFPLSLAFLPIFSRRWIPRAMAETVEATRRRRGPSSVARRTASAWPASALGGGAADGVGEVGAVAWRTASTRSERWRGGRRRRSEEARWTASAWSEWRRGGEAMDSAVSLSPPPFFFPSPSYLDCNGVDEQMKMAAVVRARDLVLVVSAALPALTPVSSPDLGRRRRSGSRRSCSSPDLGHRRWEAHGSAAVSHCCVGGGGCEELVMARLLLATTLLDGLR